MHCLPADISGVSCKEGEVSEGVFEKYRIATYKEASWKPYIIAAMIVARKFSAPGAALEGLIKEAQNASNNGLAGREISPARYVVITQ